MVLFSGEGFPHGRKVGYLVSLGIGIPLLIIGIIKNAKNPN
jgi:thiol:disulfide interchange protein